MHKLIVVNSHMTKITSRLKECYEMLTHKIQRNIFFPKNKNMKNHFYDSKTSDQQQKRN